VELTGVVSPGSLEAAVLARVPPDTEDLNRKALEAGIEAARQFLAQRTESNFDADSLDE
jgi:2-oxoglutarate ferredoxin oxidoreductase subunit gamma